MADINAEPGAFGSFLRWMDRPGQVVRNVITGNTSGALRQGADTLLEAIDAFLPGDWIPGISGQEDYVDPSELVGYDKSDSGWDKTALDIGLGIVTDPLSWFTLGGAGAARAAATQAAKRAGLAGAATKATGKTASELGSAVQGTARASTGATDDVGGIGLRVPFGPKLGTLATGEQVGAAADKIKVLLSAIPGASKAGDVLKQVGVKGRSALGWTRPGNALGDAIKAGQGAGGLASSAGAKALDEIFAGVDSATDEALAAAFHGVRKTEDGWERIAGETLDERLINAAKAYDVDAGGLKAISDRVQELTGNQWDDLTHYGAAAGEGGADYMPRYFSGNIKDEAGDIMSELGKPSMLKGRSLETPDDVFEFLSENADVDLEKSARSALSKRNVAQGRAVERATVARKILGDDVVLNDGKALDHMKDISDSLRRSDPEMAEALDMVFKGTAPRGLTTQLLAKTSSVFKPAVVYGLVLPRLAAIVRNQIGGIWQAGSTQGAKAAATAAKASPGNLAGAFADGLQRIGIGGSRKGSLAKELQAVDEAFAGANGSAQAVRNALAAGDHPHLVEALDNGVLDAFVASEGLLKSWGRTSKMGRKLSDIVEMPGEMFQGLESRMRLGSFLDLRRQGKTAEEAAQIVRDTFLDYSVTSGANRTLRDLIPFLAFTAQSIPQQAKMLGRSPATAVGLSQLYDSGSQDEPLMPWIAEQPSISIGKDEQGNSQHLVGLGLPVEALNFVPNLSADMRDAGRDTEKSLLGSSHPLVKAAYGNVSGRDPFFGTGYGSYDRAPEMLQLLGADERGTAGRLYNEAKGMGVTSPLASTEGLIQALLDDRLSAGDSALRLLTGARVASNDPDRAAAQIIQDRLERDPSVRSFRKYISGDESTDELLDLLQEAKQRSKRKAQEMTQ